MSLSRTKSAAPRLTHLSRNAFSLLEVIAGLAVVSLILIPTSKLMQDVLHGEAVQRQRSELIHRTLAWHDANANRTLDSGETAVDLWTAVARAPP